MRRITTTERDASEREVALDPAEEGSAACLAVARTLHRFPTGCTVRLLVHHTAQPEHEVRAALLGLKQRNRAVRLPALQGAVADLWFSKHHAPRIGD